LANPVSWMRFYLSGQISPIKYYLSGKASTFVLNLIGVEQ